MKPIGASRAETQRPPPFHLRRSAQTPNGRRFLFCNSPGDRTAAVSCSAQAPRHPTAAVSSSAFRPETERPPFLVQPRRPDTQRPPFRLLYFAQRPNGRRFLFSSGAQPPNGRRFLVTSPNGRRFLFRCPFYVAQPPFFRRLPAALLRLIRSQPGTASGRHSDRPPASVASLEQTRDRFFDPREVAAPRPSDRASGSTIASTYSRRLAVLLRVPGNLSTARRPPSGAAESSTEPP